MKLTGVFATDYSDASGTLAYNIRKKCWADDVIDWPGWKSPTNSQIHSGLEVIGYVTEKAAAECGLKAGMPLSRAAATAAWPGSDRDASGRER